VAMFQPRMATAASTFTCRAVSDPCLTHNEPAPAGAGSLVGLNAFSYWSLVKVTLVELAHA
jgi:hypothetical protein